MALLNFSQTLGVHGCDNGCRIFEIECTGDPKTELYSDYANRVLNGKLLYNLCPQLRPGHIIRVKSRDEATGHVDFSGYSYTVVAGNNHKANGSKDGFVYAVCHRDDEHVKFFQVDSLGDLWRHEVYVPQMSLFTQFGGILLDDTDAESRFSLFDGTDTNDIALFTDGVLFEDDEERGKSFTVFNHYYSNKFVLKHTTEELDNRNKRFVFYYVFKPKEHLEISYSNDNAATQCNAFLHDVCICGRLRQSPVSRWRIGGIIKRPTFYLHNDIAPATVEYKWDDLYFDPVAGDGALFRGNHLTWMQSAVGDNGTVLDAYCMLFFDPVP